MHTKCPGKATDGHKLIRACLECKCYLNEATKDSRWIQPRARWSSIMGGYVCVERIHAPKVGEASESINPYGG